MLGRRPTVTSPRAEADGGFSWEKLDLVAGLQAAFN
jgi:hypothetical protein